MQSDSYDRITEYADWRKVDLHDIMLLQSEIVRRDDAGSGEQDGAVGKRLRPAQKPGEFLEAAFDVAESRLSRKYRRASTRDRAAHGPIPCFSFSRAHADPRPERTGAIVDLRLRQV